MKFIIFIYFALIIYTVKKYYDCKKMINNSKQYVKDSYEYMKKEMQQFKDRF